MPRTREANSAGRVFVIMLFAASLLVAFAQPARATVIEVNTLEDNAVAGDGQCTLREAIANANADDDLSEGDCLPGSGHDVILFTTGPGTITLDTRLLITSEVTIIAPAGGMEIQARPGSGTRIFSLSGKDARLVLDRIHVHTAEHCVSLHLESSARIVNSSLRCVDSVFVRTGSSVELVSSSVGGTRGIDVAANRFSAESSTITVTGSSVGGASRAIRVDAEDDGGVEVEVRDSTLRGGFVGLDIDARDESNVRARIHDSLVEDSPWGLVFTSRGSDGDSRVSGVVNRTTLRNNGRAISTGGIPAPAFVTVTESTLTGNDVGIRHVNDLGHLFVTNSTISGNSQGINNGDDLASGGFVNINHTTITDNDRGLFTNVTGFGSTGVSRSIVAGNTTDCDGEAPSSTSYNVVGINCGIIAHTGDLLGTAASPVDPRLLPLADNGGPTQTHRLMDDSPAVDRTGLSACFIATDQRGVPRPVGQGCDAGSYELEDDVPPELTVPSSITAEATGPDGAAVSYTVTATDNRDPDPVVDCGPASGSVFALGTTTVTCTAIDASGNTNTARFDVIVEDTTAPDIHVPPELTVEATGPSGAVATYEVTATDAVDPDSTVHCVPASGSAFAIGTTTVSCSAGDFSGNEASASFDVIVQDTTPPELTLIGQPELKVVEGNSYEDPGAQAVDLVDGDLTSRIVVTNPVDVCAPGTYVVRYDVTDNAGNAADTLARTVTVIGRASAATELHEIVDELDVAHHVSSSLTRRIEQLVALLSDDTKGSDRGAQGLIGGLLRQVERHLEQGELPEEQAELLTAKAEELASALEGC